MSAALPTSPRALAAVDLVREAQRQLAEAVSLATGVKFAPVCWLRDGGAHGGGERLVAAPGGALDRGSVNASWVHYPPSAGRPVATATALSAILHPAPPRAPSLHTHTSLTELRDGRALWRFMADLNPSIPDAADAAAFADALRAADPEGWPEAFARGDRYFHIPALGRHRGIVHYYVEGHEGGFEADLARARAFTAAVTSAYAAILGRALDRPAAPADADAQLAYHTLYLFQVLTLDRGTTSGLLAHADNDVGVLGSLPSRVDRALLAAWRQRVPSPQERLVDAILAALPDEDPAPIDEAVKARLAAAVRAHYRAHPEATALQAG